MMILPALPAVSFICTIILAAFAVAPRIRSDIAQLALVLWLLVCNFIQGVNSVVWAGNTDIHSPRWCDLVTNILLGLWVAIPGACICISIKLARVHSEQKVTVRTKRIQLFLDILFCFVVPVIYMLLHLIVQDHRFNIVENFGCSASSHPSNPALILMLIPPVFLGIASLFLSGRAFHNFHQPLRNFDAHTSASTMTSFPDFSRRTSIVMVLEGFTAVITVFGGFIRSNFVPWTSLTVVHLHFGDIAILKTDEDLVPVEFNWWSVPCISFLYVGLSIALSEDVRDAVRASPEVFGKMRKRCAGLRFSVPRMPRNLLLPLHRERTKQPSPLMAQPRDGLVSGWDDTIRLDSRKTPSLSRATYYSTQRSATSSPVNDTLSRSQRPSISSSRHSAVSQDESLFVPASPTKSQRSANHGHNERSGSRSPEDEAFSVSTMQYLHSPAAQSLGLQSPPPFSVSVSPPSVYSNPMTAVDGAEWQPASHSHSDLQAPRKLSVPQTVPDDVQSTISSIFDAPWPQPPLSPPPVSPPRSYARSETSVYSDVSSRAAYGSHGDSSVGVSERERRSQVAPFQGPGVRPVPEGSRAISPLNIASRSASPILKKPRKGPAASRRDVAGYGPPGETIYMTVVQETS